MKGRYLPLVLFGLLAVLLLVGLKIAPHKADIPSPLIGKPVPAFDQPVLGRPGQRVSNQSLRGKPYLVNFWASWCVTCRVEHPVITEYAKRKLLTIVGLNFRDDPADAKAWLARYGNPYDVILTDRSGRLSIDFGVYAAPESFLVDPSGTIVYKQIGALTPKAFEQEILPRVAKMESKAP
ncbi:MAG: DsbE family thiol:disulfide interchange protein [Lysobacterales bacterium]